MEGTLVPVDAACYEKSTVWEGQKTLRVEDLYPVVDTADMSTGGIKNLNTTVSQIENRHQVRLECGNEGWASELSGAVAPHPHRKPEMTFLVKNIDRACSGIRHPNVA
jgi:hypothetical protein